MTDHLTKKLDHKWIGPFKIIKVISPAAVKLTMAGPQCQVLYRDLLTFRAIPDTGQVA
jgi:hypothetical protein